jgi:membrane protein implicated in regulation of membrane protease activity
MTEQDDKRCADLMLARLLLSLLWLGCTVLVLVALAARADSLVVHAGAISLASVIGVFICDRAVRRRLRRDRRRRGGLQ